MPKFKLTSAVTVSAFTTVEADTLSALKPPFVVWLTPHRKTAHTLC